MNICKWLLKKSLRVHHTIFNEVFNNLIDKGDLISLWIFAGEELAECFLGGIAFKTNY